MRADRGTFDIQQVNLQTPATKLNATGRFSFENDSDLQVDLTSSDAAELQAVLISSVVAGSRAANEQLWNRAGGPARVQWQHSWSTQVAEPERKLRLAR